MQLRDVAADAEDTDQPAATVVHRCLGGMQQLAMAIAGEAYPLLVAAWCLSSQGQLVVGAEKFGQLAVDEVEVGLADDFGLAGAKKLFEAAVAAEINAMRIFQPDQIGQGIEQGAQLRGLILAGTLGVEGEGMGLALTVVLCVDLLQQAMEQQGQQRAGHADEEPALVHTDPAM